MSDSINETDCVHFWLVFSSFNKNYQWNFCQELKFNACNSNHPGVHSIVFWTSENKDNMRGKIEMFELKSS